MEKMDLQLGIGAEAVREILLNIDLQKERKKLRTLKRLNQKLLRKEL